MLWCWCNAQSLIEFSKESKESKEVCFSDRPTVLREHHGGDPPAQRITTQRLPQSSGESLEASHCRVVCPVESKGRSREDQGRLEMFRGGPERAQGQVEDASLCDRPST